MPDLKDLTDSPLPFLPPRRAESHKGDYGRALLIGGSTGMCGAIAMAGLATLRAGAGLVTLAVPKSVQNTVAIFSPCFMTHGLAEAEGKFDTTAAAEAIEFGMPTTVFALGPGLGRGPELMPLVEQLYAEIKKPMVVDADALFALAKVPVAFANPGGPRILTPHPGEFGPLATAVTGSWDAAMSAKTGDSNHRIMAASCLARSDVTAQTVIVLKGHETVITDGTRYAINHTGNPGMATGGSGDVLTGIITALLCQNLTPFDAARLGVHLHGLAGDLAAAELGEVSLIATDLIEYLPNAFRTIRDAHHS
jgi:ADP-dependent NAD(P)H-hydrate dehydratase